MRAATRNSGVTLSDVGLARGIAVGAALAAAVVLLGWVLGNDALKSAIPGVVTMKTNTAIGLLALAGAIWLTADAASAGKGRAAVAIAAFVMAIGAATLFQYVSGVNLGIDQALFSEPTGAIGTSHPNRPSIMTSACFVMLGAAVILVRRPTAARAVLWLALPAIALAAVNILDYLFQAEAPSFLAGATQMAVTTAVLVAALGVGVLALLGERGPLRLVRGSTPSTRLIRLLLLVAVVAPPALAWARIVGEEMGLYGTRYGVTITTLGTVGLLLLTIWRAGSVSRRAEEEAMAGRQRLEALTAELQRSNRELQDFASAASHDLQEPLRKIRAFGDRLATRHADGLDDGGRDSLDRMVKAATRMQALITDLLAFSRVATQARDPEPVDLGTLTTEVLEDLEQRVTDTGASVEIRSLPTVEADPMQMRQLFQNLIGNALKYRRPDVTPVVRVSAEVRGDTARVTVADNGIGFEPGQADRIFAPFQRLVTRAEFEGTGMGLAICRRIVERHGGRIAATGEPGEGSTFVVDLPLRAAREERAA